ncbi:MAG: hypothetical protein BHW37_04630 [Firmicutes bacterium CAG:272_52_7]|nr:MAG: hypothetical protein BHW37_04630 [Firmicutes bacterium CAG:272_52_7]
MTTAVLQCIIIYYIKTRAEPAEARVQQRRRNGIEMAQDKKLVESITPMDTDFAQWYTDVVKKIFRRSLTENSRRPGMKTCICRFSFPNRS